MVVDGGVDLCDHSLSPRQAGEQVLVWLIIPCGELARGFPRDDLLA